MASRFLELAAVAALIASLPSAATAQSDPGDPTPPFIPPPPLAKPPTLSRFGAYPSNRALRSLVLPELVTSQTLALLFDSDTKYALQTGNLGLGFAIGVGSNSEALLGFTVPTEDTLQAQLGFLFRVVRTTGFEFGIGPDLVVRSVSTDAARDVVVRPAVRFPIYVRAGNIFRLETGATITMNIPGDGSPASAAFTRWGFDPSIPAPGIPLGFTFQPLTAMFLGLSTGYGVQSLRADGGDEAADTSFMSLEAHVGGTVSVDHRPFLDLIGRFSFPYFLIGAEDPPATQVWQLGLSAQTFVPL